MKFNIEVDQVKELLKTKTLKRIALDLNIPYYALYSFCKKNDLKSCAKRGRKNETEQYIDEVIKYYCEGMNQAQIAKKIGVSQKTVHDLIKKGAFHLRTRSEAAKLRESEKTEEQRKKQAAAANAVRHAMGIINFFS